MGRALGQAHRAVGHGGLAVVTLWRRSGRLRSRTVRVRCDAPAANPATGGGGGGSGPVGFAETTRAIGRPMCKRRAEIRADPHIPVYRGELLDP